jgi:hypothetical protein
MHHPLSALCERELKEDASVSRFSMTMTPEQAKCIR